MLFVSKCTPLINSSVLFLIISQVSDFIQSFSTMYSSVPNNKGKGLNLKGATDKLNINKQGVHIKGGGGLKIVLCQKWQPVTLIMGTALANSWSPRGASHQPAFMGDCLTVSHMCVPSHVFASFAFLMFIVSLLFKKNKRASILG